MATRTAETSTAVVLVAAQHVQEQADAQNAIVAIARRLLRSWWARQNHSDGREVRAAMEDFLPALVGEFGEQSALLSAEFFDESRLDSIASTPFTAPLADPLPAGLVNARGRYALTPIFRDNDPDAALALLEGVVDKSVKQQGRETLAQATERDPDDCKWARVPVGKTCAFCLVMASRGAVYQSEIAAGLKGVNDFHNDCDCTPVAIWSEADLPEGYDPDQLLQRYVTGRDKAKSGRLTTILAGIREVDPDVSDRHTGTT